MIAIAIYERHLSSDRELREAGKGTSLSSYHNIPRHIKNMPFVDYFVGSKSADLYEAIFEVEDSRDFGLFSDSEEDEPSLQSPLLSRHGNTESSSMSPLLHQKSLISPTKRPQSQPPRSRKVSTLTPLSEQSGTAKILHLDTSTPLSRLYAQRSNQLATPIGLHAEVSSVDKLASIETLLEECRDLPIHGLKNEMKELQVSEHKNVSFLG